MLENLTQKPQRGRVSMLCEALRLGCGKHAEATACSASAGVRRGSYASVDIGALKHNELKQAKLEKFN